MIQLLQDNQLRELVMMGRQTRDQGSLFHKFHLDDVVPGNHLVRQFANFSRVNGIK